MANNVFMTLSFEVKGLSAALDLAPVSVTVSVLRHTENQISSRRNTTSAMTEIAANAAGSLAARLQFQRRGVGCEGAELRDA
jgi:hypothetical protein